MAVLGELLAGGDASRLYLGLVKGREMALAVSPLWGLTGPWQYDGPTLLTLFTLYKPGASADSCWPRSTRRSRRSRPRASTPTLCTRVKSAPAGRLAHGMERFLDRADTLAKLQALWGDAKSSTRSRAGSTPSRPPTCSASPRTYLTAANRAVIDRGPAAPMLAHRRCRRGQELRITTMTKTLIALVSGGAADRPGLA